MAPSPRWVEAKNSRTSPVAIVSRSDSSFSIRSGSTGHQSMTERERRSITGPNHIAWERIHGSRASRHAARAASSSLEPRLSHSAERATFRSFIS